MTRNTDRICDDYMSYHDNMRDWEEAIQKSEDTTRWLDGVNAGDLVIHPVGMEEAMMNAQLSKDTGIDECVLYDTCTNPEATGLYVSGGITEAIRSCAIPSLLNTAKINGTALGKLSKENLAAVLTMCLEVAKKNKCLVLVRDGKINAFLSNVYDCMPQQELIDLVQKHLIDKFGSIKFIAGFHSHALTGADFELTSARERLLKQYDKFIQDADLKPVVRFMTSDTGYCAATVIPVLKSPNGSNFCLGKGIKVDHKTGGGTTALQKFEEQVPQIYAKFVDFEDTFQKMMDIEINNPLNAAMGMCKKCGLPIKYMNDALEEIKMFAGDDSMAMSDIYFYLAESSGRAQKEFGLKGSQLFDLEENISKILYLNWKDYDVVSAA